MGRVRWHLVAVLAGLVLVAGCSGLPTTPETSPSTTVTPTPTQTTGAAPTTMVTTGVPGEFSTSSTVRPTTTQGRMTSPGPSTPTPSGALSNDSAKAVAIAYERALLSRGLARYWEDVTYNGETTTVVDGEQYIDGISATIVTPRRGTVTITDYWGDPLNVTARANGTYVKVEASYTLIDGPCEEHALYYVSGTITGDMPYYTSSTAINRTSAFTGTDAILLNKPTCD